MAHQKDRSTNFSGKLEQKRLERSSRPLKNILIVLKIGFVLGRKAADALIALPGFIIKGWSRTCAHTHTHLCTHSHALSLTHMHYHSLTHAHTHTRTHPDTLSRDAKVISKDHLSYFEFPQRQVMHSFCSPPPPPDFPLSLPSSLLTPRRDERGIRLQKSENLNLVFRRKASFQEKVFLMEDCLRNVGQDSDDKGSYCFILVRCFFNASEVLSELGN